MVRTLHADITTAQQSASSTPFVKLVFHSFDRATTRSYATDDSPNRVLQVQQSEGRFGSYTLVEGKPFVVSSVIRLQNSDSALSSLDFKGYRVYIEWGYNASGTNRTSRAGPETVVSQELVSTHGISYLELFTVNLWEKANAIFANVANVVPIFWERGGSSETKVSHILMQLLGGQELEAVIEEDPQSTFVDKTSDAKDVGLADVIFFDSVVQVNDAIYFGDSLKFDRLSIDISDILSSGTVTILWEYSKGSGSWGTLAVLTASTGGESTSHLDLSASTGIFIEAFDMPSDWATDTVNSQGPYFYIRARATAVSSPVGSIKGSLMFGGQDFAFGLDTSNAGQGDDYLPTYSTAAQSRLGAVVEDIMSFTLMGLILREDGFHAEFIDNDQVSPNFTYNLITGPHTFFTYSEGQGVVMPNRVLVVSGDIGGGAAAFSGTSNDTAAQAEIGIIPMIEVRNGAEVGSNQDAQDLADIIIAQLKRDTLQGRIEAPMHVGQEVWDHVRVVDDRTGRTVTGRASQIIRLYQSGRYLIQIIMGGAIYAIDIVNVPEAAEIAVQPVVEGRFESFASRFPDMFVPMPLRGDVTDPAIRQALLDAGLATQPRQPTPTPERVVFGSIEAAPIGQFPGLPVPATALEARLTGRITEQENQIRELKALGLTDEEIVREIGKATRLRGRRRSS